MLASNWSNSLRGTLEFFRFGGLVAGIVGVAMAVLGQEAEHEAMRGDHRVSGVARLVAEQLGQLGFETGGALGVGFLCFGPGRSATS